MEVQILELPEPSTDQMVTFLHGALTGALETVSSIVRFTTGDTMSAAMHLIIEAGLENASPEQLRKDIIEAIDRMLADRAKQAGALN